MKGKDKNTINVKFGKKKERNETLSPCIKMCHNFFFSLLVREKEIKCRNEIVINTNTYEAIFSQFDLRFHILMII